MRLFILLVICITSCISAFAQKCNDPDNVGWKYREDADKRALQIANNTGSRWKDSVNLNTKLADSIHYAILSAYYSNRTNPNWDTVFNLLEIHNLTTQAVVKYINFFGDSSLPWLKNYAKQINPTGNKDFDDFIDEYQISPNIYTVQYPIYASSKYIVFEVITGKSYNIPILANKLKQIKGITDAGPGGSWQFEYGNKINYNSFPDHQEITFSMGFGDCPSGCTGWRHWRFRIGKNCTAQLDSVYGLPLPQYIYHTLSNKTIAKKSIKIYPNPTSQYLNFPNISNEKQYSIFALSGRCLRTGNLDSTLDIGFLTNGMYLIEIQTKGTIERHYFIKNTQ